MPSPTALRRVIPMPTRSCCGPGSTRGCATGSICGGRSRPTTPSARSSHRDGRSPARWSVLAQQTTFAPVSHDARSGGWPTADRSRALTAASKAETDVVVLTGDIHRFHAIDVVDNPEAWAADAIAGIAAVEFAVGSITSPGSDALGVGRQVRGNSGLVRGYSVVTLTPDQVRCDNWGFDDIHLTERSLPEERWLAGFTSNAGRPQLVEADGPS